MFGAQNSSDTGIIHQVLSGKREAFGVLVDRYLAQVHAVAYSRVRNRADAEDVAQETFLQAFQSLAKLREPQKFAPWLVTIARRIAAGVSARAEHEEPLSQQQAEREPLTSSTDVERREIHALLHDQIQRLDDDHREILLLYYFTGKDTRDIAAALDITNDAAKKRLQRARLALGERIADKLGDALESERPAKDRGKQVMGAILALPKVAAISGAGATVGAGVTGVLLGAKGIAALTALALVLAGVGIAWSKGRPTPLKTGSLPGVLLAEASLKEAAPPAAAIHASAPVQAGQAAPAVASAADASKKIGSEGMGRGSGVITGEVWNEAGQPEPNVTVELYRVRFSETPAKPRVLGRMTTQTDASGQFRFEGFAAESWFEIVAYTADAAASSCFHLPKWDPEKDLLLGLAPAETLSGTVTDASGTAMMGVTVTADRRENNYADNITFAFYAKTNGQGAFAIPHLVRGSWRLKAECDGYAKLLTDFVPADTKGLVLRMGEGATISGQVVWSDTGNPAPNVRVLASADVSAVAGAVSDANGTFALRGFSDGVYQVSIRDDAWAPAATPAIARVADGVGPTDLSLPAGKGGVLSGRIYDAATGRGIPDQCVFTLFRTRDRETYSQSDGTYRIAGIIGPCFVRAPWLDQRDQGVLIAPGQHFNKVDFVLRREEKPLCGKVVGEDGQPVSGALVTTYGTLPIRTGDDGRFELQRYTTAPVIVTLNAWKQGYGTALAKVIPSNVAEGADIELTLTRECSLSGIVKSRTGQPAMGVTVTREMLKDVAVPPEWANSKAPARGPIEIPESELAETLPDGRFRFRGMSPGLYHLALQRYEKHIPDPAAEKNVAVGPAQNVTDVELILGGGDLSISGRTLLRDGRPVAYQRVSADAGPDTVGSAVSDPEGRYRIVGLEAGTYVVKVNSSSRKAAAGATDVDFTVSLDDSSPTLACGVVEGRVVRADTGAPVTEYDLAVRSEAKSTMYTSDDYQPFLRVRDSDGKFRYPYALGKTTVVVRVPGPDHPETSVFAGAVTPEQPITGLVVRMAPRLALAGHIVDSQGQPIGGASVQVVGRGMGTAQRGPTATSDEHGAFTIEGLGENPIRLMVRHPDFVENTIEVAPAKERTIEIVLQDPNTQGSVEGTVTVAGQPAPGAVVRVASRKTNWPAVSADASGRFTVARVAPGEVEVRAELKADEAANLPSMKRLTFATVEAGKATALDFNFLADGCLLSGTVTMGDRPASFGEVAVRVQTATGLFSQATWFDSSGVYALDGLPPGTATIKINAFRQQEGAPTDEEAQRKKNETLVVEIPARPRLAYDIHLAGDASLSGTVAGAGSSTVGFVVLVEGEQTFSEYSDATLDALKPLVQEVATLNRRADFQLEGIKPGKYTLIAFVADQQYEHDERAIIEHASISTALVTAVDGREVAVKLAPK